MRGSSSRNEDVLGGVRVGPRDCTMGRACGASDGESAGGFVVAVVGTQQRRHHPQGGLVMRTDDSP